MPLKYIRGLLLLYGILNAALYSSLLPLWEGFDEEFHYGYVQFLNAHHRFPVLGQTALSLEINRTLDLLPLSYLMIRNAGGLRGEVRNFDQYFALDSPTRHALYSSALSIPTALRLTESAQYYTNYEVHHAPLSYLAMALPDLLLTRVPILRRIWILRLLVALACVIMMSAGLWALAAETGLNSAYAATLVFLVFSCQMFWATIAHIGNDWLSVPLALWLIVWLLRCHRRPDLRNTTILAVIFGLGLLSKAYILVFAPVYLAAVVLWRAKHALPRRNLHLLLSIPALLAGPWYLRNILLYGNLTARVEESGGVTTGSALQSLAAIPWLKSIPFMARGTFWMGNCSFTDFSIRTINTLLLLLAAALVLFVFHRHRTRGAAFLWTPVLLFCAAMIYVTGSAYTYTKGSVAVASPWYLQAVLSPLLCLAMLGCQHAPRIGRWLAAITTILWGYILAATYIAKLIPLYGGFSGGRSTLHDIAHWYSADWPRTSDILSTLALAPPQLLITLLVLLVITLVTTMTTLLRHQS